MMTEILMFSESTLYAGTATVAAAAGVVTWLVKRDVKRIVEHCEDQRIHLNPLNGYVSKDRCDLMHDGLKVAMGETKEGLSNVHKRIDAFIEKQASNTQTILQEIRDHKT